MYNDKLSVSMFYVFQPIVLMSFIHGMIYINSRLSTLYNKNKFNMNVCLRKITRQQESTNCFSNCHHDIHLHINGIISSCYILKHTVLIMTHTTSDMLLPPRDSTHRYTTFNRSNAASMDFFKMITDLIIIFCQSKIDITTQTWIHIKRKKNQFYDINNDDTNHDTNDDTRTYAYHK